MPPETILQEGNMVRHADTPSAHRSRFHLVRRLNSTWHKPAMLTFMGIVLLHWSEHIAQAIQIWGLGMARPAAKGLLGYAFPWLVTSEWLHYGFALVMLVGLILLRPAMTGRARTWWDIALAIQVFHHFEHLLLVIQAMTGHNLFGSKVPTSLIQAMLPTMRVELHLVYNALVTIPMAIAAIVHTWPRLHERRTMSCHCAAHGRPTRQTSVETA